MTAINRQLEKIRETEKQIQETKSYYRRRDLNRRLYRLRKDYCAAKRYMTEAEHGKRADITRTSG